MKLFVIDFHIFLSSLGCLRVFQIVADFPSCWKKSVCTDPRSSNPRSSKAKCIVFEEKQCKLIVVHSFRHSRRFKRFPWKGATLNERVIRGRESVLAGRAGELVYVKGREHQDSVKGETCSVIDESVSAVVCSHGWLSSAEYIDSIGEVGFRYSIQDSLNVGCGGK